MVRAETEGGGGSSTVTIGIDSLRIAIDKLDTLASSINSARASAQASTPIGLPSLADGSALSRKARWLEEQKAPLQTVLDLGILLDDKHSGTVSFTGSGDIDSIKAMLGRELANDLDDVGDIEDVGDRERMTELAAVLARYATDPAVAGPFAQELGPDGVVSVLQQLRGLTDETGSYLNWIAADGEDVWKETGHLEELQDSLATSLAQAVGAASNVEGFDKDFGDQLVNGDHSDAWSIGTLFQYGAKNDVVFGEDLLVSAGEALLEREESMGWQQWQVNQETPTLFGTDHSDDKLVDDPVLQWMTSLANNSDASQTILLDEDRADYLLDGRDTPYEDGTAAGDVLRSATIDRALDTGQAGKNAATISSHALDYFGGDATPPEGVKEELGGIIATYMADVDRTSTRSDDGGPGIYAGEHPDLPRFLDGVDLPYYGLEIDKDDLTNILEDVGDNDAAVSTIGGAAARYNQVRLNDGAAFALNGPDGDDPSWGVGTEGDPFVKAINESSELQGFLQDGLINGAIDGSEDEAAARRKVASLFMLPTEYVPVPGGPVGNFVVKTIKDEVTNAYVGDGVNTEISEGNDQYETARRSTQLQAYYSLLGAESEHPWAELDAGSQHRTEPDGDRSQFAAGDLRDAWPGAAYGRPVPPSDLTGDQIKAIFDRAEQTPGYGSTVGSTVYGAWKNLATMYGDN